MTNASKRAEGPPRFGRIAAGLIALLLQADAALAQGGQQQQPAEPPAPRGDEAQPEAPPSSKPGLVDRLGDMIKDSVDSMSSTLKGTQRTLEDINKGTVDNLSRLPVTGFAVGRALCTRAENGAPDCRAASDRLCRDRGYKGGNSLEIQTAENCNPRVLIPGYQRKPGDCRTDNYVTRAGCN